MILSFIMIYIVYCIYLDRSFPSIF